MVSPKRNQKVHRFKDGIVRSLPIIGLLVLAACDSSDKNLGVTNRAPIAAITSHSDGDQVLESIPTLFIGNVSDPNEPSEDLLVTWYADLEELCPEAPPEVDATTRCEAEVGPGVEQIILRVRDTFDERAEARVSIEVVETEAPEAQITSPV